MVGVAERQPVSRVVGASDGFAPDVRSNDQLRMCDRANRAFAAISLQNFEAELLLASSHLYTSETALDVFDHIEWGLVVSKGIRRLGFAKQNEKLLGSVVPILDPT